MYRKSLPTKTKIRVNRNEQGERIEKVVQRMLSNKEPIKDGAPLTYQERSEGINPDYDIRTDRFEQAVEAMDIRTKGQLAKREENQRKTKEAKEQPDDTPAAKAAKRDNNSPGGENPISGA